MLATPGAQCATMAGAVWMHLWPVGSWDSLPVVSSLYQFKVKKVMTIRYLFPGALSFSNARFGAGTGLILLDNVACSGTELYLFNCTNNGIGVHNCVHSEDAGIRCLNNPTRKYRNHALHTSCVLLSLLWPSINLYIIPMNVG